MSFKTGIISYESISINKGDEIQSLATKRLIERLGFKVNEYVDRERMPFFSLPNNEKVKLICNGWFMSEPSNWPPSDSILPLFISTHISHRHNTMNILTSKKNIEYFKAHGPIGCRDYDTLELLESKGVDAYFSGCMTLTLRNPHKERNNDIVLSDPLYHLKPSSYEKEIAPKLVPSKYHKDIKWVTHRRPHANYSNEERFRDAEELLDIYAKAKIVITSRIHVALPCLAMGTPVVFIDSGYDTKKERNRFRGLSNNFRTINGEFLPYSSNGLVDRVARYLPILNYKTKNLDKVIDVDWDNPPKNPFDTNHISSEIERRVKEFLT